MTATRSKDLWTGDPVWFSYPCPSLPVFPLTENIEADIAVIGAGISGATVAQALAAEGYSVIIADKRPPGRGSTCASTALLQYDLDQPLIQLAGKIGEEKARRAWLRSRQALENLALKAKNLVPGGYLQQQSSLYLAGDVLDAGEMEREAKERNAIGLPTEYLDREQLRAAFGIHKAAALRTLTSFSVDPRRLVAGYLADSVKNKARIFSPVEIDKIQTLHDSVVIHTEEGYEIRASHVVFATGYEIFKGISLKKKKVTSSWAMATKPQPGKLWPGRSLIWEAAKPYLYIRTTADGRIVCGGEDEEFTDEDKRNALIPEKTKTLQKKLKELFPALDVEAEFSWAGCFGETETSLPMIGPVPGMPNCFAILAFGGNGITFSQIATEIVRANIQGKEDPDGDLFPIQ